MIVPKGFDTYSEGLRAITEVFHALKSVLKKKGLSTAVGDEGGFAPKLDSAEAAIETILHTRDRRDAGYKAGKRARIFLALDVARRRNFLTRRPAGMFSRRARGRS